MIRTKGEPGTGDIIQAVSHMRMIDSDIRFIGSMTNDEVYDAAAKYQVPLDLLRYVKDNAELPVVNFAAGGIATPADAALMMQLGSDGVFVGSGIFMSGSPAKRASAIVEAVANYNDPDVIAEVSRDIGEAMVGISKDELDVSGMSMSERGE